MSTAFPRNLFRAARVALGLSHKRLAELAGVSSPTLTIVETSDRNVETRTLAKIQHALEREGIVFLPPEPGKGPGFRLSPDKLGFSEGVEI